MWIHGGNLTGGSRRGVHPKVLELGYTVVSIDYRLAPETKLPEIVADVSDALEWIRDKGAAQYGTDPERVGVIGHSSGGHLALLLGTIQSPPRALVSFYGYGDITGDWATAPLGSESEGTGITSGEAAEAHHRPPVSDISLRAYDIRPFEAYCLWHGLWPYAISGRYLHTDPEFFSTYSPLQRVTTDYPPTIFLHGDCDSATPHEQSELMVAELARNNVPAELVTIQGGTHSFDRIGPPEQAKYAYDKVSEFLGQHLKA